MLLHDAARGKQTCVNVDFADVVDDHGDVIAFLVVQYVIQEGGFSRAEVTGEQGDRHDFLLHNVLLIVLLLYYSAFFRVCKRLFFGDQTLARFPYESLGSPHVTEE